MTKKLSEEQLLEWFEDCYYDAGNEFHALREDKQAYKQIVAIIKKSGDAGSNSVIFSGRLV